MGKFHNDIDRLERDTNALTQAINDSMEARDTSPEGYAAWNEAVDRWKNHNSPIDDLIDRCHIPSSTAPDPELRAFMLDYIETDPYFFRSGYHLERILRRLKRAELSAAEESALRALLLKRIRTRGLRNFRDICRMIPRIEDESLYAEVAELAQSQAPPIMARAKLALSYFTPCVGAPRSPGPLPRDEYRAFRRAENQRGARP